MPKFRHVQIQSIDFYQRSKGDSMREKSLLQNILGKLDIQMLYKDFWAEGKAQG